MNITERLRQVDAYPKTLEDFRIKTCGGAIVTVISSIIIFILCISELNDYFTLSLNEELFVDTSRSSKLRINLDVIVPRISCDLLSLDAVDTTGEQHLQIDHNIYKRRLDLSGNPIQEPQKTEISTTKKPTEAPKKEEAENATIPQCGSCYGAEDKNFNIVCCNTCAEVKEAYRLRKWALPDPLTFAQCADEPQTVRIENAFSEGCQIYGYMEVNRVAGSFHIAPGSSFSVNHVHVHDLKPYSTNNFNLTHIIRHLSFGVKIPGVTNPIDNTAVTATEGAMMFHYYIKIVPTVFVRADGSSLRTNQFSLTMHQRQVKPYSGDTKMPGIFFSYELSPLMVKKTEKKKSFGHFATNICAIIGGVFTVAELIDSFLYHSIRAIQKKIELGKFS